MAAKHFSLFFFVALLLSASAQAEARESRFFSKVTRLIGTVKVITEVPTPAPAPAPAPETSELPVPVPAPVPMAGFATETDSGYGLYGTYQQTPPETDVENEMLTEEHAAGDEGFENGYGKSGYNVDSGKGNNNYYGNVNGYGTEKSGSEQQGMSDTRFLANGKYSHDVKNENEIKHENYKSYYNGYNDDQTAERGPRYVFDSMEEYEKYQESQGKSYVP